MKDHRKYITRFCIVSILLIIFPVILMACGVPNKPDVNVPDSGISAPIEIRPYNFEQQILGDGWIFSTVHMYYINTTRNNVGSMVLEATNATLMTTEGQSYPVNITTPEAIYYGTNIGWSQPIELYLGDSEMGGTLPIPPSFPSSMNYGTTKYVFAFRYAEAAHPTQIIVNFSNYPDAVIDLTSVVQTIPEPTPAEIGARPLSELVNNYFIDNADLNFTFTGTCISRVEEAVRNLMVYLPYTAINKDKFNEKNVEIDFLFATYIPGGNLSYSNYQPTITIGPGQTKSDLFLIDLLFSETDPFPLYLINFSGNNSTVYQLNCSRSN